MPDPIDPAELELVRQAICEGRATRGCCEWWLKSAERLRKSPPFHGFQAQTVRQVLCDFVADNPEALKQVAEKRLEYPDRKYYYKVILPIAQLANGLFVEIILFDRDPELPTVLIVNAHQQRQ